MQFSSSLSLGCVSRTWSHSMYGPFSYGITCPRIALVKFLSLLLASYYESMESKSHAFWRCVNFMSQMMPEWHEWFDGSLSYCSTSLTSRDSRLGLEKLWLIYLLNSVLFSLSLVKSCHSSTICLIDLCNYRASLIFMQLNQLFFILSLSLSEEFLFWRLLGKPLWWRFGWLETLKRTKDENSGSGLPPKRYVAGAT